MTERSKMKAVVLHGIRDLKTELVDIPEIKDGQVLVKIHAAGICGSDVERVFTKGTYHYPTIIGHEFAGEVVKTCESDKAWMGKRVGVFPLIPCMTCDSCLSGNYAQCKNYNYYGSRCDGGDAEYLAVNTWNLLPIPDNISYESAAMLEPTAVAVHALRQAGDLLGKALVIFGVGAIGLIVAQAAKSSGCSKVILVARSKEKEKFAKEVGFTDVINSSEETVTERISELTNGGADILVEGCGKSETLETAVLSASPFATVICLGNPIGDMNMRRDAYWAILRKQLTLKGTWNSSFKTLHNSWQTALELISSGNLQLEKLITGRYKFEQANEAFNDIFFKNNGHVHIKSMFIN